MRNGKTYKAFLTADVTLVEVERLPEGERNYIKRGIINKKTKRIVRDAVFFGLTYAEVAEREGINDTNVEKHVLRGLRMVLACRKREKEGKIDSNE